jgi:hypothetical protein
MIPPGSHATVSGSSAMNVSTSAQQPEDQTKSTIDSRDFDGSFPGIIDGKRLVGVETVLCPVAMHFSHQLIGVTLRSNNGNGKFLKQAELRMGKTSTQGFSIAIFDCQRVS